ncbi:Uncharacterized protein APZ42_030550 [Daphnia magna]|uniref:Secreted protein n=1 Tax=Daphnia magna TaxID=35525 RepID=A0A162DD50_9CRUS|nr:Uncharacterized protein APZ42_030550 [Daphnia magna]
MLTRANIMSCFFEHCICLLWCISKRLKSNDSVGVQIYCTFLHCPLFFYCSCCVRDPRVNRTTPSAFYHWLYCLLATKRFI